jgi:hypothetical protein
MKCMGEKFEWAEPMGTTLKRVCVDRTEVGFIGLCLKHVEHLTGPCGEVLLDDLQWPVMRQMARYYYMLARSLTN